jgi:hypothetical protein
MGWWILVFYPELEARDTCTNIRPPMLKLNTLSDFHDLFRFELQLPIFYVITIHIFQNTAKRNV